MSLHQRARFVSEFTCLGDACPDTCCRNWSMQLDEATLDKYKQEAPDFLDAVEQSEESPWIMRKDKVSGYCVKFESGWCGIHKQKGSDFLGDACFFYPRITRALGDDVVQSAALSCPEIARLVLQQEDPFALLAEYMQRLPHTMKHYLPDELATEDALAVHQAFMTAAMADDASAEQNLARIASVSRSIALIDIKSWPQAVPFYIKNSDARLPEPVGEATDAFNLLLALAGLIVASQKPIPDRLHETIACMEEMLDAKLNWQTVEIHTTPNSQ
ncbi:MAG: flagellin lysine-N-methylase, partial [Alphaproteobacteria bacterium]